MITHIVVWKLREADPSTRARDIQEIRDALVGLIGVVPEIAALRVDPNILDRPGNWDLMLTVEVASESHLEAYAAHPAHLAAVEVIRARVVERAAIDLRS